MKKVLILVLVFLFVPIDLIAKEYDNKAVITHKGKKGVFIDEETFTEILKDLKEFQILKSEKIPELNNKIAALQRDIKLVEKELKVTEEISSKWKEQYLLEFDLRIKETSRLQEQLDKKGVWYKSPAFTFSLGIVAGGLLSVGLAWGFSNASDKELWNN